MIEMELARPPRSRFARRVPAADSWSHLEMAASAKAHPEPAAGTPSGLHRDGRRAMNLVLPGGPDGGP